MNAFFKCLKIESSFIEDDLIIPKKGEVCLEIDEDSAALKLRFKAKKGLFDSAEELKTIERKVKN
jgi:hypothetical protein